MDDNEKLTKDRDSLISAMKSVVSSDNFMDHSGYNEYSKNLLKIIESIKKDVNQHFLSLSQDTSMQVSYARKAEDKFNSIRRVRTTLGRYLSRFYKLEIVDNIPDHAIDFFVSNVWALLNLKTDNPNSFKILKGKEISTHYESIGHNDAAHSCMTGNDGAKFVKFYADNPEKINMVVYEGIRALLWNCDDGTKVLDRMYPSGHGKSFILHGWAKKQGYVCRDVADRPCWVAGENGYNNDTVALEDESVHQVTLSKSSNKLYPYLDTFCFGKFVGDNLILSNSGKDKKVYFRDTYGKYCYLPGSVGECYHCKCVISCLYMSYCVDDKDYCRNCFGELFFHCCYCEGAYDKSKVIVYNGACYCKDCYEKHFAKCDCCEVKVLKKETIIFQDERYCRLCHNKYLRSCYRCRSLVETDNADWLTISDYDYDDYGRYYCERCSAQYLTFCVECDEIGEKRFMIRDGNEYYCEDCVRKMK